MCLFLDTETTGLPLRYGRPAAQIGNWLGCSLVDDIYDQFEERGLISKAREVAQ
jgi:hypothetical protein